MVSTIHSLSMMMNLKMKEMQLLTLIHDIIGPLKEVIHVFMNEHIPEKHTTHNPTNDGSDAPIDHVKTFLMDLAKLPIFNGSETCMLKALVLILQFQVNSTFQMAPL